MYDFISSSCMVDFLSYSPFFSFFFFLVRRIQGAEKRAKKQIKKKQSIHTEKGKQTHKTRQIHPQVTRVAETPCLKNE